MQQGDQYALPVQITNSNGTVLTPDNNGPTAFVDTPECFFFQRSTASTAVSASITLQSWSNTTHTYYVFFSNNGSNRRIAVSTRMEGHWK